MNWRKIALGAVIVVVLAGAVVAMKWIRSEGRRPALASVPPLAPVTRSSTVIVPTTIELNAIRDALEKAAPPQLSGKSEIPPLPFVGSFDFAWAVARGEFAVAGGPDGLTVSSALNGTFRASGQLSTTANDMQDLQDLLGSLFGGSSPPRSNPPPTQGQQNQPEKIFEQTTNFRGSARLTARPTLLPEWRIEPNLTTQVSLSDASLDFMGTKLNVPEEVKPMLESSINDLVASLQSTVLADPVIEQAARQEWAKMCRSISLGATAPDMPNLWLEVRPTRAFAAQPGIDQKSLTLTVGVQSDTRIVPNETRPNCPFPERLEIVPQTDQGRVSIAVPMDIPFTEINRLMEEQLKGKVFPEDRSGSFSATIKSVNLAASGDRLLISVGVRANETKTWFGFGADATIYVWGRPILDTARQTLRLKDLTLDVESESAFGVLGVAARAALPYLEAALDEKAVIDLVPLARDARRNIEAAVADFRKNNEGIQVDAQVLELRLVGLEFDATTLRVIGEAEGTARATVTKLD
jgi:hypothetical protein